MPGLPIRQGSDHRRAHNDDFSDQLPVRVGERESALALELGDRGQDVDHQPPLRRGGVDPRSPAVT